MLERLRPWGRATITLSELVEGYLEVHQAAPVTIEKLRWLLGKATLAFGECGSLISRRGDLRLAAAAAGGSSLRGDAGAAAGAQPRRRVAADRRQPGQAGRPNPLRRFPEKRPFESWAGDQSHRRQARPGPRPDGRVRRGHRARPAELSALEQRDVDRRRRRLRPASIRTQADQAHKDTAQHASRATPSQRARSARAATPRRVRLLFPAPRGGYIDLHNFRARQWRPAQLAAGIEPIRRPYDLRHTYATFALRAGISIFDLSRFMGASLAMIDRHYGHLARDGREHAVALLDASRASRRVDAAWTPHGSAEPARPERSRSTRRAICGAVDVSWTPPLRSVAWPRQRKERYAGASEAL